MCGIAGIIDFKNHQDMQPLLQRMAGFLHHRGPDAAGLYLDDGVGLGHARLSIIDLAGGDQPIHNEDHSVWIVYNGEVFNYPELREELISRGHSFYTTTDTEVIVHLYEEMGPALFEKLNGQFAFAIWDARKRCLLLGRDRVGIRPSVLYPQRTTAAVCLRNQGALCRCPHSPRTGCRRPFQTFSPAGPRWTTAHHFTGVRQVPAGHYAEFSENGIRITPLLDDPCRAPH